MVVAHLLDIDSPLRECIDNCTECHAVCERTAFHCLGMGGEHASEGHQSCLRDCAQLCAVSVDFMVRESPLHSLTCRACAAACRRCAEDCERMAGDDPLMRRCAEICRRCHDSCERMAGAE